MPEYKCLNKECDQFNVIVTCNSITKIKDGKLIDSAKHCHMCNSSRLLIEREGMTTAMQGSVNICKH